MAPTSQCLQKFVLSCTRTYTIGQRRLCSFQSVKQFSSIKSTQGGIFEYARPLHSCKGSAEIIRNRRWLLAPFGARLTSSEAIIKAKVRGIQKDISPLTTKKIVRRKRTKDSAPREQVYQCLNLSFYKKHFVVWNHTFNITRQFFERSWMSNKFEKYTPQ